MIVLPTLVLALAGSVIAAPQSTTATIASGSKSADAATRCSALAQINLKNVQVTTTKVYADNTTFTEGANDPAYPAPVPGLPSFCRYAATVTTSAKSSFKFEVWLPVNGWNGRWAMVGNGGVAGGINWPDMRGPIATYGFAVSSTNTGHSGNSGNGTFAINNPESQIDFGYRAVSMTAELSKAVVSQFYKKTPSYNYWIGCSSGGKQGLKELQINPSTFDGVIAGAAAQWWPHLNAQTYRINALVNTANSTGYLNTANYAAINKLVISQCDKLDGLEDGIITNPRVCLPDLSPLRCDAPTANASSCLSSAQLTTMTHIWANWTTMDNPQIPLAPSGFFGFEKGAEGVQFSVTGTPYGPGPDYFNYQVLNNTEVGPLNVDEAELTRLIRIADATDPGQTNAIDPNIAPFFKRGGKLITYVGMADGLIPSGSSVWYHEYVKQTLQDKKLDDSFRFFEIPGMGHCRSGNAAWNFGGPGQRVDGTSTGTSFDKQHDMILALMDWVEKKQAPDMIIGAKYKNDTKANGVAFERPLCPYPKQAKYKGGDANSASSFKCEY